jgi:hypothetical protein
MFGLDSRGCLSNARWNGQIEPERQRAREKRGIVRDGHGGMGAGRQEGRLEIQKRQEEY